MTLTDPALDAAWRLYHHGSLTFNAALLAMEDAGVLLADARRLLDAPQVPSQGWLAESTVAPYVRRVA